MFTLIVTRLAAATTKFPPLGMNKVNIYLTTSIYLTPQ